MLDMIPQRRMPCIGPQMVHVSLQHADRLQPVARPQTRLDCIDGPRPCPWAGCRYHLLGDVTQFGSYCVRSASGAAGRETLNRNAWPHRVDEFTDYAVDVLMSMEHTCALDVADMGVHGVESIADVSRLESERIRQELNDAKRTFMARYTAASRDSDAGEGR